MVLSLFPGVGLLDAAFEEAGFCVVRGPDVLWGGDIKRFHPPAGKFDGLIGGPPCQEFCSLSHLVRHRGYTPKFGNLIPQFERCASEARPRWYLMENVTQVPLPDVDGYGRHSFVLNNRQLGETVNRSRRWSFGWRGGRRVLLIDVVAIEAQQWEPTALGGHGRSGIQAEQLRKHSPNSALRHIRRSAEAFAELKRKQGLPDDFDLPAFKIESKCAAVGNGVPRAMGLAIARAVREQVEQPLLV